MSAPVLVITDDFPGTGLPAALAAAQVESLPTPAAWDAARLVLLDARRITAVLDALVSSSYTAYARRRGVIVIGFDLDDADVWRAAVGVGAERVIFMPDAEPWLNEHLVQTLLPLVAAA